VRLRLCHHEPEHAEARCTLSTVTFKASTFTYYFRSRVKRSDVARASLVHEARTDDAPKTRACLEKGVVGNPLLGTYVLDFLGRAFDRAREVNS